MAKSKQKLTFKGMEVDSDYTAVDFSCNFVSGEFVFETLQQDKERIVALAKEVLRTDYIEFVK